jgi:hypothetical protein
MVNLQFFRPHTLFGRAISLFEGSPVCHVAIGHTVYGVPMLTQADGIAGVQMVAARTVEQPIHTIEIPWVTDEFAVSDLSNYLGDTYGYLTILSYLCKPLNRIARHEGQICSELAVNFLHRAAAQYGYPDAPTMSPAWQVCLDDVFVLHGGNASLVDPAELYTTMQVGLLGPAALKAE